MFYLNQTCFFMKMTFTWGAGWVGLLLFHLKNKRKGGGS